eukprot:1886415-Alexandrium_andersonii.AAC.1
MTFTREKRVLFRSLVVAPPERPLVPEAPPERWLVPEAPAGGSGGGGSPPGNVPGAPSRHHRKNDVYSREACLV